MSTLLKSATCDGAEGVQQGGGGWTASHRTCVLPAGAWEVGLAAE